MKSWSKGFHQDLIHDLNARPNLPQEKLLIKDNLRLICVLLRGYVRRCASSWSTGNELFLSCEAFPLFNAAAFHVFDVIPGNPPELPTSQPSSSGHVQQSRVRVLLAQHVTPPLPLQHSNFCSSIKHQRASSHL